MNLGAVHGDSFKSLTFSLSVAKVDTKSMNIFGFISSEVFPRPRLSEPSQTLGRNKFDGSWFTNEEGWGLRSVM